MREWMKELMLDYRMEVECFGSKPGISLWLDILQTRFENWVAREICVFRDHDLIDEVVDAESGRGELTCQRCGWSKSYHMN